MILSTAKPYTLLIYIRGKSVPLDRGWWFRRNIVANAIHPADFINNLIRDLRQELIGQMSPICRHGISGSNSTQSYRMLIGTLITHHADTTNRTQQDGTSLPDLIVKSPLTQTFDIDIIGILKDTHFLWCDISENTNGESRSWERMTGNQMLRHAELTTHPTHFVLEQPL